MHIAVLRTLLALWYIIVCIYKHISAHPCMKKTCVVMEMCTQMVHVNAVCARIWIFIEVIDAFGV